MMSDTTDGEPEESDAEILLSDAIEFGRDKAKEEVESQDGEIPEHAARLAVARATEIMREVTNIQMLTERDDRDTPPDDYVKDTIEEAVVELLLSIGAIDYEYDLRIADAFERRKEFIEAVEQYEKALEDIESQQEAIDAFDEHMGDHVEKTGEEAIGGNNPNIGENVDAEDYDPDHRDRHIQ